MRNRKKERIRKNLESIKEDIISSLNKKRRLQTLSPQDVIDLEEGAVNQHEAYVVIRVCNGEGEKLTQIEKALKRLESEIYGVCEECGEEISPPGRLKAIPWAALCLSCQ